MNEKEEVPKLVSNFEVDTERNKVTVFLNPRIFPLSLINKVAASFKEDAWLAIDGDPEEDVGVELRPKKDRELEELAKEFNNRLIEAASLEKSVDEKPALVSRIQEVVRQFVQEEHGRISKQSIMSVGALLTGIGLGTLELDDVTACSHGSDAACCLTKGTKITMADGSLKNVEDVEPGDKVLGYDPKTKEIGAGTVLALEKPLRDKYYKINNGLLNITNDHPVFVEKQNGAKVWTSINPELTMKVYRVRPVYELEVGDKIFNVSPHQTNGLLSFTEQWVKITSIEEIKGHFVAYDLRRVEKYRTYFANGMLVHNGEGEGEGGEGGPSKCFPRGTKILMADHTFKNIENLREGDEVISFDHSLTKPTTTKITGMEIKKREGYYVINKGMLRTTDDHPLRIMKKSGETGWGAVDREKAERGYPIKVKHSLEKGDSLLTIHGWKKVTELDYHEREFTAFTIQKLENGSTFVADDVIALTSIPQVPKKELSEPLLQVY